MTFNAKDATGFHFRCESGQLNHQHISNFFTAGIDFTRCRRFIISKRRSKFEVRAVVNVNSRCGIKCIQAPQPAIFHSCPQKRPHVPLGRSTPFPTTLINMRFLAFNAPYERVKEEVRLNKNVSLLYLYSCSPHNSGICRILLWLYDKFYSSLFNVFIGFAYFVKMQWKSWQRKLRHEAWNRKVYLEASNALEPYKMTFLCHKNHKKNHLLYF